MSNQEPLRVKYTIIQSLFPTDVSQCLDILKENYPNTDDYAAVCQRDMHTHQFYAMVSIKGGVIAFGCITCSAEEMNVYGGAWVNVKKEYQGKGYGTLLINHLLAEVKKKPRAELVVITCKAENLPFYQKFGFKIGIIRPKSYFLILRLNK